MMNKDIFKVVQILLVAGKQTYARPRVFNDKETSVGLFSLENSQVNDISIAIFYFSSKSPIRGGGGSQSFTYMSKIM